MFKYIVVGGDFGETSKPSSFIDKLFNTMHAINQNGTLINGGKFSQLNTLISDFSKTFYDAIFWMPNVSNEKEKLVRHIKKNSFKSILVTSKNNIDNKYGLLELTARALNVRANLFLILTKESNKFKGTLYDPLGNLFCSTVNVSAIARTLIFRVQELLRYTRVNCIQLDDYPRKGHAPDKFYDKIKYYADVFHNCIHSNNTERMLGNASFRCERGFPSYKGNNGQIYISQRNIDKRFIDPDHFVAVIPMFGEKYFVGYYGNHKPSVDTPIQLLLYHYYYKIKYIIHSHTFIAGAPLTEGLIPCGALEEYYEIINVFPDRTNKKIALNLQGHGSIFMCNHISSLEYIPYIPRKI